MNQKLSSFLALLPLTILVVLLVITVQEYGTDALSGAGQVVILTASAVCVVIGMGVFKIPFNEFEKKIEKNVSSVTSAIFILLIIGTIGGTWMISGVVPTLIYYGIQVIHPSVFLASTCVICALISVMTGSSWTTVATIGIALMGIGRAQGFSDGWIAGAIISGAYFGDKMSPLSDTTVMASGTQEVALFDHIRYMVYTTVPSAIITILVFIVAGFTISIPDAAEMTEFITALHERFYISPVLLLVPAITCFMIYKRLPSLIILFLSSLTAVIFAMIFQADVLRELADGNMFKGVMQCIFGETALQSSNDMLTSLIGTSGMAGMLNTVWLVLCAMCFGGVMEAGGMLSGLSHLFAHFMKNRVSTVASTVCSGLAFNLAIGDQYISILLTGNMFRNIYDRLGYERRLLSRATEDSATITSVLVPWNTCGLTQSTVLGVPTLTYLPYCIFNIISPIMSIIIAATGYKIVRKTQTKHQPTGEV